MNRTRRMLVLGGAVAMGSLLTGCATPALFENKHYTEEVSSVLISQDKQKLVFMSDHYHYVFDAPPALVATLGASFHHAVSAELWGFHVDHRGAVTGQYALTLQSSATDEERAAAVADGFTVVASDSKLPSYQLEGEIKGMRYDAGKVVPGAQQRLNNSYSVSVEADPSDIEFAGKLLVSPIALAADGLLTIGAIPLVAIGVGIVEMQGGFHFHP